MSDSVTKWHEMNESKNDHNNFVQMIDFIEERPNKSFLTLLRELEKAIAETRDKLSSIERQINDIRSKQNLHSKKSFR